jgi:hypothetical protein
VSPFLNLSQDEFANILDRLSDDQLRKMEGNAREALISRLLTINNVQSQLFGVSTQLTQLLQLIPDNRSQESNINANENENQLNSSFSSPESGN